MFYWTIYLLSVWELTKYLVFLLGLTQNQANLSISQKSISYIIPKCFPHIPLISKFETFEIHSLVVQKSDESKMLSLSIKYKVFLFAHKLKMTIFDKKSFLVNHNPHSTICLVASLIFCFLLPP